MNGVNSDTRRGSVSGFDPGSRCRVWLCALLVWILIPGGPCAICGSQPQLAAQESVIAKGRLEIHKVKIEGNTTIPTRAIAKKIKIRPGQSVTSFEIRNEEKALLATRWFLRVESKFRETDEGYELVFKVWERPILRGVTYKGNDKVKTKRLEAITNLREGGAFAVDLNREAVRAMENYYREKGYLHVKITLEKGGNEHDREVVFDIKEGPKVVVSKIRVKGGDFFGEPLLKTKLKTKKQILWLIGGKFDPATIPDDIAALKEYYFSLGFFDVEITHELKETKDRSKVMITYTVNEGKRFKMGDILIEGSEVIAEEKLRSQMKLHPGDYFDERKLTADLEMMKGEYGKLGRIFAVVNPVSKYFEEPGQMDLIFNINEDKQYRIRKINVIIDGDNPTTKETVALNQLLVKPWDLADPAKIRKSKRRLEGGQIWGTGQVPGTKPPAIQIKQVKNIAQPEGPREIIRAQASDAPARNPIINNSPQGDPFGNEFGGQQNPYFPDPGTMYPNTGLIDLDVNVSEAQTGRLMIGAGINSDSGLVGSIVLDEKNFDLFRPPTSWDDIWNGRAWRGDGQQFRLEAVPGTIVNRYLFNWREPYLFDRDISLGVSGFLYDRIFDSWRESRTGGRVTFGKQYTQEWSGAVAFRLEDVELSDPDFPTPPSLASALGNNFLSTVRASIAHDTRDAAFLPSEGHYVELAYEQGFGDYIYPRVELEGRQYFQVGSRPDGSGRQIISLRGELGWTGEDTPIFEKFYAGGFQSFRGFRFRGVSPREFDVTVGGEFLALGSLEYMHPLMANDSVQAVVFTDFGSVEENVGLSDFRVTAGAGLRITIPQLGPVPLALDWAIPIMDQPQDDRQLFQFYFGVFN